MSIMDKRKIILYVQSAKKVAGTETWGRWGYTGGPGIRGGYRIVRDYKQYSETKYEWILPEDQKSVVEIVKAIAHQHGFDVEVVDVAKSKKKLKIKVFPTLVMDSGEKIEGVISKEQIIQLLTKI
ncbi:MAG: hypothetical protein QXJ31_02775 [Candidatus Bathyarchaeia archaeon]